jgi:hypothetical protein
LLAIAVIGFIPTQPPRTLGRFILITGGAVSLAGGATILLFSVVRLVARVISMREERRREEEMLKIIGPLAEMYGKDIYKLLNPKIKSKTRYKVAYRLASKVLDIAQYLKTAPEIVAMAVSYILGRERSLVSYKSKKAFEYAWERFR